MASEELPEDEESFAGRLRVLELYSGIGGMHWALKESGVDYDVVQAMDVNTSANAIYQHNFPQVSICASSISKLTLEQLGKWSPNTLLMSPPCQPFTRVGKKQDCQDPRTQSFLHLMDLLRKLEHKPEYILVENVKGFEVSETRSMLVDMLNDCKYAFQEFLLTPLQFGVPNCRMRYYLIAKLKPLEFAFWTSDKILDTVPMEALQWLRYRQSQNVADSPAEPSEEPSSSPHCEQCHGPQSEGKPPSPSGDCAQEGVAQVPPHHGHHPQTAEDSSHRWCRPTLRTCEGKCAATASCEWCGHCSEGDAATAAEGQRTEGGVDRCGHGLGSSAEGGGRQPSSSSSWCGHASSSGDGGALTVAEAGRNMRHCEEEDALVCADGTHLEAYLEKGGGDAFQPCLVPDKELRMFVVMDVVHPSFKKSSCFTKRYGHYIEGAGSLIMMTDDAKVVKDASDFKSWAVEQKNRQQWGELELSVLRRLKLRYFTPREEANLLCFPPEFEFPSEGFNSIQCYRVLGNSLNVHVVSILVRLLLMEPGVI